MQLFSQSNVSETTILAEVLRSHYMVFAGIIRKFDPKCSQRDMIKKWMRKSRVFRNIQKYDISFYRSNEIIMEIFKYFCGDIQFCQELMTEICKGNTYPIHDVFSNDSTGYTHQRRYSEIRSFLVNEASVKVEKFIDFGKLKVCKLYVFPLCLFGVHKTLWTYS